MAVFEYKGKSFYIDGKLKEQLDKKAVPNLQKRDKDEVIIIDGHEGSGKSKFADILGAYMASKLGTDYSKYNVCMTPEEFRSRIIDIKDKSVVIYDEAHRGMGSRRALSEINNILIDMMMEMRQKNLFVIIVIPTIFMLDKYPALFRAKGLFHIYERKQQRGFWVYFNEKNKLKLYQRGKKEFNYNCMKYPKFRGKFLDQWSIDKDEYTIKKRKAFEEKPRITRAEHYMHQRNVVIYLLWKLKLKSSLKVSRAMACYGLKLSARDIREILVGFKRKIEGKAETEVENIVYNTYKEEEINDDGGGEEEIIDEEKEDSI